MSKRYIPPRRRHNKILVSFSGLFICFLLTLSLVSVASIVQASFITTPFAGITKHVVAAEQKISDSVATTQVSDSQTEFISALPKVTNVAVTVANFPLEKAWPVRGRLTTLFSSFHPGIDIATAWGTPIHPFASGVVLKAQWWGTFGNGILIQHADGWQTIYAHLSSINVAVNQQVDLTTVIGAVGSTGNATGPHLHFQVSKDGREINPLSVLP